MSKKAIIVTDSKELSAAIARYLSSLLDFECKYFTYKSSGLLSCQDLREADLFVYDLFKLHKNEDGTEELRAEGIHILDKIQENKTLDKKKFILISGEVLGDELNLNIYWDMGSKENLLEKIKKLLEIDKIDYEKELSILKDKFNLFLIRPKHH